MAKPKSDPTKDPAFQKVVQHFLKTEPEPHKGDSEEKPKPKRQRKAAQSGRGR